MSLRVAIPCSGLGRTRRGYERFAHELAEALMGHAEVRLFAGVLPAGLPGRSIPCLHRDLLGRLGLSMDPAYYWEQVTFSLGLAPALGLFRPDVIHLSDPTLTNVLLRVKKILPGRPKIIFSNGSNRSPKHYARYDHVQLITPWQLSQAMESGIDPARVTFVPLGIQTSRWGKSGDKQSLRRRLGLPSTNLAITVAALNRHHKRIDYLIEEFGLPDAGDWSLLCLGQRTADTPGLEAMASSLAPGRVLFRTVSPDEVADYLRAADLFVLASREEPFGLAVVEAMAAGLPVIARDLPSQRYILEDDSQIDPLLDSGALVKHLIRSADVGARNALGRRNQLKARERFDWASLVPAYLDLYRRALEDPG